MFTYSAKNLTAKKREELSPDFEYLFPKVMFGLTSFSLEGVNGSANSWNEMGKWFYDQILVGTSELPSETKEKIKTLVGNETDLLKVCPRKNQICQHTRRDWWLEANACKRC
jgi:hypothetical protein